MPNYDIQDIITAFMGNPGAATGLSWERGRGQTVWQTSQHPDGSTDQQHRRDTLVIKTTHDGLPVFHHNGGASEHWNFWEYFKEQFHTNEAYDVICRLAEVYGIQPDLSAYTPEQMERYETRRRNGEMLNATARFLTAALNGPKGEAAREYLKKRRLKPSDRLAAYGSDLRDDLQAHLLQRFPGTPARDIQDFISNALPFYNPDDYQLIIPYYNGTTRKCTGFVGRLTTAEDTYTDRDGREVKKAKYRNSSSSLFIKGGYCTDMKHGLPVVIVEGNLDAERLKQSGLDQQYNVFAFGTQTPTGASDTDAERNQIATLQRYGTKHIIYVPDFEFDAQGNIRTAATENTIRALAPYVTGDEQGPGFMSLRIAQLFSTRGKEKVDADSFIIREGRECFAELLEDAETFWEWQLETAAEQLSGYDLCGRATSIYYGIRSAIDREMVKKLLDEGRDSHIEKLRAAGFTSRYLEDLDRREAVNYLSQMYQGMSGLMAEILNRG